MACGCRKRMADMKASKSKTVRKIADAIEPAHNAAMRVMDRVGKKQKKPRRFIGRVPVPPSEN